MLQDRITQERITEDEISEDKITQRDESRRFKSRGLLWAAFASFVLLFFFHLDTMLTAFLERRTEYPDGTAAFVQKFIGLICGGAGLMLVGISLAIYAVIGGGRLRSKIPAAAGAVLCLAGSFMMVVPPVRDIAYINHPETVWLAQIELDSDSIGDSSGYGLSGVQANGRRERFDLSRNMYRDGAAFLEEHDGRGVFAQVVYLPHTRLVYQVRCSEGFLKETLVQLGMPEEARAGDWKKMALFLNGREYQLPFPVSDFLEAGWRFQDTTDINKQLAGSSERGESYRHEWAVMVNPAGQRVSAMIYNLERDKRPMSEGTIGILQADDADLNYAGTDVVLPGGQMLGWASEETVEQAYGKPDDRRTDSATGALQEAEYWAADNGYGHKVRISFDENGIVDSVWVENQDYNRTASEK